MRHFISLALLLAVLTFAACTVDPTLPRQHYAGPARSGPDAAAKRAAFVPAAERIVAALMESLPKRAVTPEFMELVLDSERTLLAARLGAAESPAARRQAVESFRTAMKKLDDAVAARLDTDADLVSALMARAAVAEARVLLAREEGRDAAAPAAILARALGDVNNGLLQKEAIQAITPGFMELKLVYAMRQRDAGIAAAPAGDTTPAAAHLPWARDAAVNFDRRFTCTDNNSSITLVAMLGYGVAEAQWTAARIGGPSSQADVALPGVIASARKVTDGLAKRSPTEPLSGEFIFLRGTWSLRLRDAELLAARTAPSRRAAAGDHYGRMVDLRDDVRARLKTDATSLSLLLAEYYVLEAAVAVEDGPP